MANAVLQFQIVSKVPDKAASFYSSLFGWKIDTANPLGYRGIDTGSEEGIQGGIWPAPPQASDFVQLFVAVDEIKSAVKRAEDLGATLIIPPSVLPEGDEMAILRDPQGLAFGLWRKAAK